MNNKNKIKILDNEIEIDILNEILPYFENDSYTKITEEKLIAKSPFREDNRPSFFINLSGEYVGVWKDSGAEITDNHSTGNFPKLLAYLRNESYHETCDYLIYNYSINPYDRLELPNINIKANINKTLEYKVNVGDYSYLNKRGISKEVAKFCYVTDTCHKISIHWINRLNEVIAIKYRDKDIKRFSYEKGGRNLSENLYNINLIEKYRNSNLNIDSIWITEGEIDALTVIENNINNIGIAIGGAYFSDKQAELISYTGIDKIVIATDNDLQGKSVKKLITKKLYKYHSLYEIDLGDCKDVNEYFLKYKDLPNPILITIPLLKF